MKKAQQSNSNLWAIVPLFLFLQGLYSTKTMLHKGNSVSMDPVVIGTFQKNNYEGKTQSLAQKHH